MSPGRWKNIRSLLQFALSHAGLAKVPGRYGIAPSARWAALTGPLEYGHRYQLGHLARYCTAAGVEPEQVSNTVMKGFLEDLQDRSLVAEPTRIHRNVIVAWNHNVTASPEWPQRSPLRSRQPKQLRISVGLFPAQPESGRGQVAGPAGRQRSIHGVRFPPAPPGVPAHPQAANASCTFPRWC